MNKKIKCKIKLTVSRVRFVRFVVGSTFEEFSLQFLFADPPLQYIAACATLNPKR